MPPPPLQVDGNEGPPQTTDPKGANTVANAQAIAATPAGQAPLGHSEQQLFDGFTFTADNEMKKGEKGEAKMDKDAVKKEAK